MDSSKPAQEPSGQPSEEHIQLVPVSVQPSSSSNSTAVTSPQPEEDTAAAAWSAPAPSGSEHIPSHTSFSASSHTSVPAEQTLSCGTRCSHHATGCGSCASHVAAAADPCAVCGCSTKECPSQTLARDADGSPPSVSTVLQTETEQPGPSCLPPAGAPQPHRGAADGGSATRRPPPGPGPVCERAPCCAVAAQPCHVLPQVHSLPDMRLPRTDCEAAAAAVSAAPAQLSPAVAATSSEPTTGQAPASRPSASSGIRTALQSVASHTSFASPLSSIGPFCRICHEGESRELLISPCRCAGSVGLVHVSCIEKWLSAANKDSCEICMYKYVTERRPKPLFEWLLNPSNPEDARNLVGDVICFFLLTALAVIAAYLCLMAVSAFAAGASHYLSYKTQWEATGLVVLGLLISTIYCVWLVVTCRYHCRVWQDWRRTHQDVYLLEMKRRSHSTVDMNNNACVPLAGAGARCRVCRGGSYSCAHCCAVCPHHAVQLDTSCGGAAVDPAAADDVFDDGSGAGGGGGGICGATAVTLENDASVGAEK